MPRRTLSTAAPLSAARRLGFVLVTLAAFAVDALTIIPEPQQRAGQGFTLWGTWETSIVEFVPLLGAVYAVLLLRRRWPLLALVGISAVSLSFTVAAVPALPLAGVLVTLYTAAALVEHQWQALLALGLAVGVQLVGLLVYEDWADNDLWLGVLLLSGISYSMWVLGRRDHSAALAAMGLPGQLAEHGQLVADQERRRIARELHDIVAHSVSAMMMQAAGAKAVTTGLRHDHEDEPRLESVERALSTIENTGSQSMRELHRLLSVLRGDDAELEPGAEPSSQPGMAEIAPLVELTRQTGLVVEVHVAGPPVRLDPSVGLAAYRVVQETLTNAMKHGGRGAVVDIFQNWRPDTLQLQVRCRGGHEGSLDAELSGGSGLGGLRERVGLVGGSFEFGPVGDEFVATAVLPLTPEARAEGATALHRRRGSRLAGPGEDGVGRDGDGVGRDGDSVSRARDSAQPGAPLSRARSLSGEVRSRPGVDRGPAS